MIQYFKEILNGIYSLISGMAVTLSYFFKKPVTVIYPKERIAIKRFKGPITFTEDEKGDHKCISCTACITICPSRCMSLQSGKSAIDSKRILTDFKVNYMLCSLCSLCIDVCPTDALKHDDEEYDIASFTQKELIMDLLEPFRQKGTPLTKVPILKPGETPQSAKPAPTQEPAKS